MKAEHAKLVEKKTALKSALSAARGTVTKFDQIASFWQEFVLEPEEREEQKRRRANKSSSSSSGMTKSKSDIVIGIGCPIILGEQQQFSSDDSSLLLSRHLHLLQSLVGKNYPVVADPDRRDRCDSAVQVVKQGPMMPEPKPRPAEININFDSVEPPLEDDAAAAAAARFFI